MKALTKSIERRVAWEARHRKNLAQLSQPEIRQLFEMAYRSERLWSEHMCIYLNLFTDEKTAEIKARTHSIKAMCNQLRKKYGCSYQLLYQALKKEVDSTSMVLCKDLLNTQNKYAFVDSLSS